MRPPQTEADVEAHHPSDSGELDWFPLEFGVGSMDASGTDRLLGQPEVEIIELLIRESAQNSWDARLPGIEPEFGIRCRVLDRETLRTLRREVFAQGVRHTFLQDGFERSSLAAIEIWDRGTSGLNGPVRSDRSVPEGSPTNFIDLVFNVGTANKGEGTGGSFGFGKSSAFKASRMKTVIYWTVCELGDGRFEHRLIASGLGSPFDEGGRRFTGRHWWGKIPESTGAPRVEPLTGEHAEQLGRTLFERHFGPGETGTSILVLDPDPAALLYNEESTLAEVNPGILDGVHDRLRKLVVKNLWPKLLTDASIPTMRIIVGDGDMGPADLDLIPGMTGYATALRVVRSQQLTEAPPLDIQAGVSVIPIWAMRPKQILGHLVIDVSPRPAGSHTSREFSGQQVEVPLDAVCLMRSRAELVVKYLPAGEPMAVPELCWTAVFKPLPELDGAFAQAETPAHDDWVPTSMAKSREKTYVNVGLREIRRSVRNHLSSFRVVADSATGESAAALAAELSDLGGIRPDSLDETPSRRRGGGRRGTAAEPRSVEIESVGMITGPDPTSQVQRIRMAVRGVWKARQRIELTVRVSTAEGSLGLEAQEMHTVEWGPAFTDIRPFNKDGSASAAVSAEALAADAPLYADVELPGDLAFSIGADPA